jgi:hypothetical protein
VDEVEIAWFNARILFDRMFEWTPLMNGLWTGQWSEMQRRKLSQPRMYRLLRFGCVQYEILNGRAARFFAAITRPDVTVQQMQKAIEDFVIQENDIYFDRVYTEIEKEYNESQRLSSKHLRETDGGANESPLTKKQKKEQAQKKSTATPPNGAGGSGSGGGSPKHRCFRYLSTAGCDKSDADCLFLHESATSLNAKSKKSIKKGLAKMSLVPDPAMF